MSKKAAESVVDEEKEAVAETQFNGVMMLDFGFHFGVFILVRYPNFKAFEFVFVVFLFLV